MRHVLYRCATTTAQSSKKYYNIKPRGEGEVVVSRRVENQFVDGPQHQVNLSPDIFFLARTLSEQECWKFISNSKHNRTLSCYWKWTRERSFSKSIRILSKYFFMTNLNLMGNGREGLASYHIICSNGHLPLLDGFDQHFQASVHFPPRRWLFFPLKFFWECWDSNPGQLGPEANMPPIVATPKSWPMMLNLWQTFEQNLEVM